MKTIKFLVFIFFCLPLFVKAQFEPTKRDEIRNEREKLLRALNQSWELDFLYVGEQIEGYNVLTGQESELILLLRGEYDVFFETLFENEEYFELNRVQRGSRIDMTTEMFRLAEELSALDSMETVLLSRLIVQKDSMIHVIRNNSKITESNKDFLLYYIEFSLYQHDFCNEILRGLIFNLWLSYSTSTSDDRFKQFLIKYEGALRKIGNRSGYFGVSLGSNSFLRGEKTLRTGGNVNFQFDYHFPKYFVGARLISSVNRTQIDFVSDTLYDAGRPVGSFSFDALFGANLYFRHNKNFVQPYIGYGAGIYRGSKGSDSLDLVRPYKNVHSGFVGVKAHHVFWEKHFCRDYTELVQKQYFSLFLDVGMRFNTFSNRHAELKGNTFYFLIGLGLNTPFFSSPKEAKSVPSQ
jgi:hypothetical protein